MQRIDLTYFVWNWVIIAKYYSLMTVLCQTYFRNERIMSLCSYGMDRYGYNSEALLAVRWQNESVNSVFSVDWILSVNWIVSDFRNDRHIDSSALYSLTLFIWVREWINLLSIEVKYNYLINVSSSGELNKSDIFKCNILISHLWGREK